MLKNKKADLSLSINAIVILILAITMLGLGLTFMRGLFTQATSKVEAAVSAQDLTNPPTIDNPLTLYPTTLTLRANEQGKTTLAFMHTEGANRDCTLSVIDKAGNSVAPGGIYGNYMIFNVNAVNDIPPDKIYTWTITIDPDESTATINTLIADCGTGVVTCPHLYTTRMTCAGGGTYKKDLLVKII